MSASPGGRAYGGPGAMTPPGPADSRAVASIPLFRAFTGLGRAARIHLLALLRRGGAVGRTGGLFGRRRAGRLGGLADGGTGGDLLGGDRGALRLASALRLGSGPALGELTLPLGE